MHYRNNYEGQLIKSKSIEGNAFFLILIGIFLLGGLTVLITRTGGQTEETGSSERLSLAASEITKYAGGLKSAVDSLRLRGCSETQISFWTDTNNDGVENSSDTYYNANAPIDRSCHLFSTAGAGMKEIVIKDDWVDSAFSAQTLYKKPLYTGKTCVPSVGTGTGGCSTDAASNEELLLIIPFLKQSLCKTLNSKFGISSTPQVTADTWAIPAGYFTGTYVDGYAISDGAGVLSQKQNACFQGASTPPAGSYNLYVTLIAR